MTAYAELAALPKPLLRAILAEMPWRYQARTEQLPPEGEWRTWYVRGGRGSGKTWTGSNTLAEMPLKWPGDYGVVAPTFSDMRDKCIEGPSGLLAAYGTTATKVRRGASPIVESWNRSMGEMRLRNGSVIHGDGADDGAPTIQGYNLRGLWADEVGLWRKWKPAWEESIRFAVRLYPARIIATGTPKRGHPLVKALMSDATVLKTLLKTSDNAANLDPLLLAELYEKYAGSTLGRQELEGEILEDVPGALWRRMLIEYLRVATVPPVLKRIVVAIDPSATSAEGSDEAGVTVTGIDNMDHGYLLEDCSLRGTPNQWASAAIIAYHRWKADKIVAEVNNGGEMVGQVIRNIDPTVAYKAVTATRGKQTRAEPVATLYEQGRIHHVGVFEQLEDQMCGWIPGEKSPDRMDSMVWGFTELMVEKAGSNPWATMKSAGGVA